jgi:hypothetical protein
MMFSSRIRRMFMFKKNGCHLIFFISTIFLAPVSYSATIATTVPFETITLNPNDVIQAGYSFGLHPIVFCFDNSLATIANIRWPYQGALHNTTLPETLTINPQFEGDFADPNGVITITNTTNFTLIISCQFGF